MIRKHWMLRDYPTQLINLKEVSEEVNEFGYESMLLTVYPRGYDMWTLASNLINNSHTFKYMMAIRPYLYSPQFLAMLVSSFSKISNDRLMLNMVHGAIREVEDFNGIIGPEGYLNEKNNRREYMVSFLSKFFKEVRMSVDFKIPEVIMSGQSEEVFAAAKEYSGSVALWHDMFTGSTERVISQGFNKVYISTYILVTDSDEEATEIIAAFPEERRSDISLYGSKDTIRKQIQKLESMGVTDILFSQYGPNFSRDPIHKFLQELSQEGILS